MKLKHRWFNPFSIVFHPEMKQILNVNKLITDEHKRNAK